MTSSLHQPVNQSIQECLLQNSISKRFIRFSKSETKHKTEKKLRWQSQKSQRFIYMKKLSHMSYMALKLHDSFIILDVVWLVFYFLLRQVRQKLSYLNSIIWNEKELAEENEISFPVDVFCLFMARFLNSWEDRVCFYLSLQFA